MEMSRDNDQKRKEVQYMEMSRDSSIYGTSYGRFVQKVIVSCFSDSFCHILLQCSDGSHYATINPQLLHNNFRKKVSLFLQKPMKNSLFVKTTASPSTTTRRVFYPLVNIIYYYLETLKNY